jgi:hypothetical protein
MQKKLLMEAELAFISAIVIIQSMTSAAANTKQLQSHSSAVHSHDSILKVTLGRSSSKCYRCGKSNREAAIQSWRV